MKALRSLTTESQQIKITIVKKYDLNASGESSIAYVTIIRMTQYILLMIWSVIILLHCLIANCVDITQATNCYQISYACHSETSYYLPKLHHNFHNREPLVH
jgi:hypothetical protein